METITRALIVRSMHVRRQKSCKVNLFSSRMNEDLVELLLELGANKEHLYQPGLTAIHMAVRRGLVGAVMALAKHGTDVNKKVRSTTRIVIKMTPNYLASRKLISALILIRTFISSLLLFLIFFVSVVGRLIERYDRSRVNVAEDKKKKKNVSEHINYISRVCDSKFHRADYHKSTRPKVAVFIYEDCLLI